MAKDVKCYVGIDPGASGGMVLIRGPRVETMSLEGATEQDVWEWVAAAGAHVNALGGFAVIERISNGFPGTGKSQMAKLYGAYRALRMALVAAGLPFEEVPAAKWQYALGIPRRGKGQSRTEWKNVLKTRAQSLFPKVKVTLAIADALLLAEFCRRKREGML